MRGSLWIAALGEEVVYGEDLPACCRRTAASTGEDPFECPVCGAMWQVAQPVHPEEDAFGRRGAEERRGAA